MSDRSIAEQKEEASVKENNSSRHEWTIVKDYSQLPLLTRFFIWLLGGLLSQIKIDEKNAETIRQCLKKGAVVHVIQYRSYIDYLVLNYFLCENGLPPLAFSQPNPVARFLTWLERIVMNKPSPAQNQPENCPGQNQLLLFLQQKGKFLSVHAESQVELLEDLIDRQCRQEMPIYLLPQICIWSKRPISIQRSWLDIFLGNPLQPGRLRKLVIFLRNYRHAFVRYGEPIDLNEWVEGSGKRRKPKENAVSRLRWDMFQFFTEERVAVTGPATRPRTWILETVLKSDQVQNVIRDVAAEEQVSVEYVELRAAQILETMSADYRYSFIAFADWVLSRVFRRIYNPIVVDKKGFERIRELIKKHPVVFTPSHKSHIDYLVFSFIMFNEQMAPPHIIAGDNLSFFPMGFIFRRMGAIFIRRSFAGDRLYTILLKTYLNRMLEARYNQEFFIEGGRSRTGKLLLPRLGILSMIFDGYLENPERDIMIQPISMSYSKLIEQGSYSKELEGENKKKEGAGQLIKAVGVLKVRYGAIYINAGEPISLKDYLAHEGLNYQNIDESERRRFIKKLGNEIIARINEASTVTATSLVSLALLASGKKGISQKNLVKNVEFLLEYVRGGVAQHVSDTLDNPLWAVTETLEMMKREGQISIYEIGDETIYTINENKRLALDFYKNNIIHFFMPTSILALALLSFEKKRVDIAAMRERSRFLAKLFSFEIILSQDAGFSQRFENLLNGMVNSGMLVKSSGDEVELGANALDSLQLFASMIRNFVESYWVAARVLPELNGRRMNENRFIERVMMEGKKLSLTGELRQGEAYSKNNFINALQYFTERGVLVRYEASEDTTVVMLPREESSVKRSKKDTKSSKKGKGFRIGLSQAYSSEEALKQLLDELSIFIGDFSRPV